MKKFLVLVVLVVSSFACQQEELPTPQTENCQSPTGCSGGGGTKADSTEHRQS